jgi:hypothetical protein
MSGVLTMLELPKLLNSPPGLITLFPPFNYDPLTEVIAGDSLIHSENAVFTREGRYFVAGEHLTCARLRPSNSDASAGSVEQAAPRTLFTRRHTDLIQKNIRPSSIFNTRV